MVITIKAFDKEWEINSITRQQRRELHALNKKVYAKSTFNVNSEKPEIVNLEIDYDAQAKLIERALDLAFDDPSCLDDALTDAKQDALSNLILKEYLLLSPKDVGD